MTIPSGELPLSSSELLDLYRRMLLIRLFEEKAAEMYTLGKIRGFVHLYSGEEAIAVGAISAIQADDYAVSSYRDHGYAIAKGSDPKRVMAELFGKVTGLCRGKGGSMHIFDAEHGFLGGYAIVGGGIPIAVGAALASAYRSSGQIVLNFFGDGAINEGAFHESLNLAALWKLPVAFIIENNQYAMGTSVAKSSAVTELYKRACSYGIPAQRVDGMDVLAMRQATLVVAEQVRKGQGPMLLEAMTYRFRGHSMADPEYYRKREETESWRPRDPLKLFTDKLRAQGVLTDQGLEEMEKQVETQVQECVDFADQSAQPPETDLYQDTCVDSFCPAYIKEG